VPFFFFAMAWFPSGVMIAVGLSSSFAGIRLGPFGLRPSTAAKDATGCLFGQWKNENSLYFSDA